MNALQDGLAHHSNHAWSTDGKSWVQRMDTTNKDMEKMTTPKKIRDYVENQVQPGTRHVMEFEWKGRNAGAHIISVDRDESGNLRFYDPQNGQTMQGNQIDDYIKKMKTTYTTNGGYTTYLHGVEMLRVDDKFLYPATADAVLEGAK